MKKDKKDKKEKEKKIIKIDVDNEEDLMNLLNEIESDKSKKVVVLGLTFNIVKNGWLNFLLYYLINALLITASFCIFRPVEFETHLFLFVFITVFTIVDYVLKLLIYKFGQKLILYTATLIFFIVNLIAIAIACVSTILLFEIAVSNTILLIGSLLTFLIVRFILIYFIRRK